MIESSYFWSIIFFLALGTLVIRGTLIAFSAKIQISDRLKEIFSFIPASILPAFVAPSVFFHQGQAEWAMGKERFFVLVLATIVCYYSRSTLVTIIFGIASLYVIGMSL